MATHGSSKPKIQLDRLDEAWKTAYFRVAGTCTARRLWEWVFTPAEREKLGNDLERAYAHCGGTARMWMHVHNVSYPRAVVEVATRCNLIDLDTGRVLLRKFGEAPSDPKEAVEWAVNSGGLVLVELWRQAYWAGTEIPIDWADNSKEWVFLWTLAQRSKAGGVLDAVTCDILRTRDPKALTKRKSRTINLPGFPQTLADMIVPVGRGTYRLDLLPTQIHVFELVPSDAVREWVP